MKNSNLLFEIAIFIINDLIAGVTFNSIYQSLKNSELLDLNLLRHHIQCINNYQACPRMTVVKVDIIEECKQEGVINTLDINNQLYKYYAPSEIQCFSK